MFIVESGQFVHGDCGKRAYKGKHIYGWDAVVKLFQQDDLLAENLKI